MRFFENLLEHEFRMIEHEYSPTMLYKKLQKETKSSEKILLHVDIELELLKNHYEQFPLETIQLQKFIKRPFKYWELRCHNKFPSPLPPFFFFFFFF